MLNKKNIFYDVFSFYPSYCLFNIYFTCRYTVEGRGFVKVCRAKVLAMFNHKKFSSRAGFEPTREYPIGFLVQRLNHSATVTCHTILQHVIYVFMISIHLKTYRNIFLKSCS